MGQEMIRAHEARIVELVTGFDKVAASTEGAGKVLRLIAGSEAFHRYNWLTHLPELNASGNLRGMVVSPGWRVVFSTTSDVLETIGNVAMIASFAGSIAEQLGNVHDVLHSNDTAFVKGLWLTSIAGTAAERTLAGVVSSGSSLLFQSLQGYCMLGGMLGGRAQSYSQACVEHLQNANVRVQSSFKMMTDTYNQAQAIYWIEAKITGR